MKNNRHKSSSRSRSYQINFKYEPLTAGDHEVFLAGSFNGFDPRKHRMSNNDGIYEIKLNLPEGKYEYKVVVDGIWMTDETAEEFSADGFGGENSVVYAGDPHRINSLKKVPITVKYHHPDARIYISGTFNNWNAGIDRLFQVGEDLYRIILLLKSGEYKYKLLVDGKWQADPESDTSIGDGFGGTNSVLKVDDRYELYRGGSEDEIFYFGLNPHQMEEILNPLEEDLIEIKLKTYLDNVEHIGLSFDGRSYSFTKSESDNHYDYFRLLLNRNSLPVSSEFFFCFRSSHESLNLFRDGFFRIGKKGRLFRLNWDEITPFLTPQWVKEGIIYQIFPDRFYNGDPDLNQNFGEWYYKHRNRLPESGKISSGREYYHFIEDWYNISGLKSSPYHAEGKPDIYSFYGGDLAGIRKKLDYLEDLGITILYLNPVCEGRSNHKYDAADYMKIDPHLGTNRDFREFTSECHRRGIRIILDFAFNHTGDTFWAFQDALKSGPESDYYDWYEWKKWPVPKSDKIKPDNYYSCWWGFGHLPELDYDLSRNSQDENAVRTIGEARVNWGVVYHILEVAEFWLLEMDIDGFRLDVPNEVPFWFWKLFRNKVKSLKPEAYLVGEIWHNASQWVNNEYFDAVMNYAYFKDPVIRFFNLRKCSAADFVNDIRTGLLDYPVQATQAMMNLLDSHDTYRYLEIAKGDPVRLKLAVLFQMTFIGVPHIWYGDEVGMRGSFDPDCRRPFYWKYEEDRTRVDIRDYYRKLIVIRKDNSILVYGSFNPFYCEDMVLVYERAWQDEIIWVAINNSSEERSLELPNPYGGKFSGMKELLTARDVILDPGSINLKLAAWSGSILKFRR